MRPLRPPPSPADSARARARALRAQRGGAERNGAIQEASRGVLRGVPGPVASRGGLGRCIFPMRPRGLDRRAPSPCRNASRRRQRLSRALPPLRALFRRRPSSHARRPPPSPDPLFAPRAIYITNNGASERPRSRIKNAAQRAIAGGRRGSKVRRKECTKEGEEEHD